MTALILTTWVQFAYVIGLTSCTQMHPKGSISNFVRRLFPPAIRLVQCTRNILVYFFLSLQCCDPFEGITIRLCDIFTFYGFRLSEGEISRYESSDLETFETWCLNGCRFEIFQRLFDLYKNISRFYVNWIKNKSPYTEIKT